MFFFFFNDTATTEIYTLSLHDALPICLLLEVDPEGEVAHHLEEREVARVADLFYVLRAEAFLGAHRAGGGRPLLARDRKSTRLNSSHANISYAVFCLKKKKKKITI